MKLKSILYRNFETLNDIEKQFFNDTDCLSLCDATNVVYLADTELIWIEESFESLSNKALKTIENHPKQLIAVCRDYLNSIS
jgi:hypothetical protein